MKGIPGSMAQLVKQANQMQNRMKKVQEELAQRTYEGRAGGGGITVTVNGEYLITSMKLDPELIKSGDADMIQDMVMLAVNDAVKLAKETSSKEMEKVTGGFNMPGLF